MAVCSGRPMLVDKEGGLPLRQRFETSSAKIGDLEAGTRCSVQDTLTEDGVEKARVLVVSGPLKGKEGWVMFTTKTGEKPLIEERGIEAFARLLPKSALDAAREAFSSIDVDSSGSLSKAELKEVLTKSGGDAAMKEAELDKIIATFDVNGDGQLNFAEFAVMFAPTFDAGEEEKKEERKTLPPGDPSSGAGGASAKPPNPLTKQNTNSFWKRPGPGLRRQATSAKLGELVSRSFAKRAKATRGTFSFKKGGTLNSLKSLVGFGGSKAKSKAESKKSVLASTKDLDVTPRSVAPQMSAMALTGLKKELLQAAAAHEKTPVDRSLGAVLGDKIKERGLKVDELVREWDVLNTGEIKRVEFRQALRSKKLGLPAEKVEKLEHVDALFDELDADHSGALDLGEMKVALKQLLAKASELRAKESALAEAAVRCRQRAQQIDAAIDAAKAYEEKEIELRTMRVMLGYDEPKTTPRKGAPPVVLHGALDVRLYGSMVKRNMKIGELILLWDKDRSGTIDKKEFGTNVKAMVPTAADDEIGELFATLDAKDGNGTLDMGEITRMLRMLVTRANKAQLEESGVAAKVKELKKASAAAQKAVLDDLAKDDEEAARREAKEEAEAEAVANAAAEAAELAKASRSSKVSTKAAEKAAFDAKVAARRSGKRVSASSVEC